MGKQRKERGNFIPTAEVREGKVSHAADRLSWAFLMRNTTEDTASPPSASLRVMAVTTLCARCNSIAELPCPSCHSLLYCSATCAADDAPIHQLICASFTSPPPKPTSGKNYVLGILFPEEVETPALVWVRIDGFVDEDTNIAFQEADVGPFFGRSGEDSDAGVVPEALHSERNGARNRDTRSMLEVWRVAGAVSGAAAASPIKNGCIQAMGLGKSGPFYQWKGPVLVLAMTRPTGFMVDPGAYHDCQLQDFQDAVDFVLDYGNDAHARSVQDALDTLGHSQIRGTEGRGEDENRSGSVMQQEATTGEDIVFEVE